MEYQPKQSKPSQWFDHLMEIQISFNISAGLTKDLDLGKLRPREIYRDTGVLQGVTLATSS